MTTDAPVSLLDDDSPHAEFMRRVERFLLLKGQRRDLQRELLENQASLGALEEALEEDFISGGLQLIKTDRGTIYKRSDTYVSLKQEVDSQNVIRLFYEHDLREFLTFGSQRLRAYVKQVELENEAVPNVIADNFNITKRVSLSVRDLAQEIDYDET